MNPALARPAVWVGSGLVALLGGAAVVGGAFVVVLDMQTRTDDFDGLGVLLGLVLGGLGAVLLAVAGLAAWLARRHTWGAGVMLCVLGLLMAGVGVLVLQAFGSMMAAPIVLTGLLVGGIGFGAAVGASSGTIGSSGGYPR